MLDLISENYLPLTHDRGAALHERFAQDLAIHLPHFLSERGLELVLADVEKLKAHSKRKDFQMEESGGSWRHLRTVRSETIRRYSILLPDLFDNEQLLEFVSGVAGEKLVRYADPENLVLLTLERKGDMHGSHCDDFTHVLNIGLEMPPLRSGGILEYVPRSKDASQLGGSDSRQMILRPGDAYVMSADAMVHHVTKLTRGDCRRTIASFSYATPDKADAPSYSSKTLF